MVKRATNEWKEKIKAGVQRAWKEGKYSKVDYSHTEEHKQKISQWRTGKTYEEIYGKEKAEAMREMRRKQLQGNKNLKGKTWTLTEEQRMHHATPRNDYARRNLSESKKGEKNPAFNNWSSYEPYTKEFNAELKKVIGERDDFTCQYCFESSPPGKGCPHHIDYNKKNSMPSNLVWVCLRCNSKFNTRRDHWQGYWTKFMIETEKIQIFPKNLNNKEILN